MAEEIPADVISADIPERDTRWSLRPNTQAAVVEILERKRLRLPPAHKLVALRHGVSEKTLRSAVSRVKKGEIKLNPSTPQELAIDKRIEMHRTLSSLDRLERLLNDSLEGMVKKAEEYAKKGKVLAYRDMGIPLVIADMKAVASLRNVKEEGYMAILEKLNREKQAKDAVADVPSEKVEQLTQEQRAARALRELQARRAAAAPMVEVPPAPTESQPQ